MTENLYEYHRNIMVKGKFQRYSSGNYDRRNRILVNMLKGYNFKVVIEVAGAEGDLAEKILSAYPDIELYSWSDLVSEAVDYVRGRIEDPRFTATCLDLDEDQSLGGDLFISTSLEHTLRYREIIENLQSGTLVLLSLPNFGDAGHRVFFPQFTGVIKVYGDLLDFLDIKVFVAWMGIKDMAFIVLKRCLEQVGVLRFFRRLGILKTGMGTDKLPIKWLVLAKRAHRCGVCK